MKNWKKYLLYGVIGFLILGVIGAIFGEPQELETISIQDTQLAMDVDNEKSVEIAIEPKDIQLSKSDFVIEDESIVEIDSIDGNKITLKTLSNEGTTTFYCQRDNIKSNAVTIKVTDEKKVALAKAEDQRKSEEKIAQAKKIEEEKKIADTKKAEEAKRTTEVKKTQEQKQTTQKSTSKNTSSSSTKQTGEKVYITPTGKKYHAIPKCGNTKSSSLVSLSDAQSRGLGACSKCY